MASYQSLYRRYRPQRFDEVLGQDHVTKALRNAVRDGRVGHAYLFSGPRGTGKTSTARILAKVLNCAAPVDGEPCGTCETCVAVAEGRVTDWLLEQDAASKSKVDDMRDLLERVPLGTSGNRKVIILDEVHMLSQGAENALLKTLEEPPSHVVFVLATTDPQKVRPTIRSRTQHFEFRLLPPDVLADHVRHVIDDAGLGLDAGTVDQAVDHVIRSGGGSARDTLSALDQVAALGEVVDESQPIDAILDALCDRDAGRVLVAVADALASGRDPRTLGETLIGALRDAFLSVMGVADQHLAPAARDRAARVGERMGPAGLTRALDVLGEALTELSRKPDPRVVVEVALIRITQPSADRTLEAVLDRLDRLERGLASGGGGVAPPDGPGGGAASGAGGGSSRVASPGSRGGIGDGPPATAGPPPAAPGGSAMGAAAARDALSSARRPAGDAAGPGPTPPPGSGRPTLGALKRGQRGAAGAGAADGGATGAAGSSPATASAPGADGPGASGSSPVAVSAPPAAVSAPVAGSGASGSSAAAASVSSPSAGPSAAVATADGPDTGCPPLAEIAAAWGDSVLGSLPVKIRSKWRGGRWIEPADGSARFAVPNEWHLRACDEFRLQVEQALAGHFGRPVAVTLVVEGDGPSGGGPVGGASPGPSGGTPPPVGSPPGGGAAGDEVDEHIDPSELRDADDVATTGVDMLLHEFGGGEVFEEDP